VYAARLADEERRAGALAFAREEAARRGRPVLLVLEPPPGCVGGRGVLWYVTDPGQADRAELACGVVVSPGEEVGRG
jgi:hypothetical protein